MVEKDLHKNPLHYPVFYSFKNKLIYFNIVHD